MKCSLTKINARLTIDSDSKDLKKVAVVEVLVEMIFSPCFSVVAPHSVCEKFILENFYSVLLGGGGHRGHHGPRRGQDVGHELRVTLEDLYNGKTKKLAIQRQVICKKCAGKGGTGAPVKCPSCRGSGVQGEF